MCILKLNNILQQNEFNIHLKLNYFRCTKCDKIWSDRQIYERHFNTCKDTTIRQFKGGPFRIKMNLFDLLELAGINVPQHLRNYPYIVTWDTEAMLIRIYTETNRTKFTFRHEVISISICSNVPGYTEPICIMRENNLSTHDLVNSFLDYLLEICQTANLIMMARYEPYRQELDDEALEKQFDQYMTQMPVIGMLYCQCT